MQQRITALILAIALVTLIPGAAPAARAAGTTYYVSSSSGSDASPGTSVSAPLATIARVNALALQPGDRVLFRCGDTWRGEMLYVRRSGAEGSPISFGAYPEGCTELPVLSGAHPVAGWATHASNIYVADLRAGANAARFPLGVNQLFRGAQRLPFGRWPNANAADGGYATISAFPSSAQISADGLPDQDWSGAHAHIKGMRWYILNRQVSARAGNTLTLSKDISCYEGTCAGWGFWLSNHLATLDQEGEWFYDTATSRLYLYTAQGAPADGTIEASAILRDDDRAWGGITLGEDLKQPASHIVVERLAIVRWWRHGIATPTNHVGYEPHHLSLRDNLIRDVDGSGINLASWVFDAQDGRPNGWRGGYSLEVHGNTIERANRYGVLLYSRDSTFSVNTLRAIALIGNLGAAGMGCKLSDGEGGCTQDGTGFMVYAGNPDDSGHSNLFERNRLEQIGYNGFLVFGFGNTIRQNVIKSACQSKGDCAGIRPFGDLSKSPNPVRDMLIEGNLILDTLGATEGTIAKYRPLFAFGINADYGSNITMRNNIVARTSSLGLLYKESSGAATGNLLYDNGYSGSGGNSVQISVGRGSRVSLSDNIAFALHPNARTIAIAEAASLTASDGNRLLHAFQSAHLALAGKSRTLELWRSETGLDGASTELWYRQADGEAPRSTLFVNDRGEPTTIDLGRLIYRDLDQQLVSGTLSLAPYSARVLVLTGEAALAPAGAIFASHEAPARSFTLKNVGAEPLSISAIEVSPGFAATHTCPTSLAPEANCTIMVRFTDTSGAPVSGSLSVRHDAGEPYTATLLGAPLRILLPLVRR
jgi:hypothetical protein